MQIFARLAALLLFIPVIASAQRAVFFAQNINPVASNAPPSFYAVTPYAADASSTVTTTSDSCPAPHVKILFAEEYGGNPNTGSASLSTTTTNTIIPIAGGGWPGGSSTEYAQAWYVLCNGSTGTYTVTMAPSDYATFTVYEASAGVFDTAAYCGDTTANGSSLACSVTATASGLGIGFTSNSGSGLANASVTGWTNRLNISQQSVWDQPTSAGTVTLPSIYQASNYSVALVVNLKP